MSRDAIMERVAAGTATPGMTAYAEHMGWTAQQEPPADPPKEAEPPADPPKEEKPASGPKESEEAAPQSSPSEPCEQLCPELPLSVVHMLLTLPLRDRYDPYAKNPCMSRTVEGIDYRVGHKDGVFTVTVQPRNESASSFKAALSNSNSELGKAAREVDAAEKAYQDRTDSLERLEELCRPKTKRVTKPGKDDDGNKLTEEITIEPTEIPLKNLEVVRGQVEEAGRTLDAARRKLYEVERMRADFQRMIEESSPKTHSFTWIQLARGDVKMVPVF